MTIIHECSPGCSHDDPLAGAKIASEFDLKDFESEIHTCDSGCSHDPMADAKPAETYDLGDFAELAAKVNHTYAGAETSAGRIEVVTSAPTSSLAVDSVNVAGLSKELTAGIPVTLTVAATGVATTTTGWSRGEVGQSAAEMRVERSAIEESKRASVAMAVSGETEATKGSGSSSYGVVERAALGVSATSASEPLISRSGNLGEIAAAQFTATELSKQAVTRSEVLATVQMAPYPNTSTFERIQRGESASAATTSNYQGVAGSADRQTRITSEVNGPRTPSGGQWQQGAGWEGAQQERVQERARQPEQRAAPAEAKVTSERFLGWASQKPMQHSTNIQPTVADSPIKAEQRVARVELAERVPSSVGASTPSSRVEPKIERFMGWAAERAQGRGEANFNQPAACRNSAPAAVQQATVSSQRLEPKAPREVGDVIARDTAGKIRPESDTRVITRVESRQERVPAERSLARDVPTTSRELGAQSSTQADSRRTPNRTFTNESSTPSPVPGIDPKRVDRKQTSNTVVYSGQEPKARESSRGLRKVERLISERLKNTVEKLSERLSKPPTRRSAATLAAQVSQLALNQLALMNKMLEILDEANEGREEHGEYPRARRPRRLKVKRLQKNRNRLVKKRKAKKVASAPQDAATQTPTASRPVGAGAPPLVAGTPNTGLAGAHNSGPSKSLDVFQSKADDDSANELHETATISSPYIASLKAPKKDCH